MKVTSRFALAAALGFSVAVAGVGAPALAAKKKDEKPAAPTLKLSDGVRKELAPAQDALGKKDLATADAAIARARAAAKTPDDSFMVAQFALNSAQASGDQARLSSALDELITTGEAAGQLSAADKVKYYGFQGSFAYQAKDYQKTERALSAAVAAGSTNAQDFAVLADVQAKNGRPADALATIQKLIDANKASGAAIPNEYYARAADIASRGKMPQQFANITTAWLAAYPARQNWHDALMIYRQLAALQGDADLDVLRLGRAAGVLPLATQATYIDYALAVYLKYPGEAVAVLNEGIKAGKLSKASSKNTAEILALSEPKIGPDRASLPSSVTAANGAKASFKSVETTGDVFYGYNDFAKAAEMYKLALTKPGADPAMGNVRLGAALAQAGDKEGARAAFNAVTTGPYAVIANYWKVLLDHPAS